jgi:hypothetical protein
LYSNKEEMNTTQKNTRELREMWSQARMTVEQQIGRAMCPKLTFEQENSGSPRPYYNF